ncbi:zinc-finger domain-containing protein [Parageobacillus toebii]|uniref:zinc-finger domain-containing protein n=1 Tax=Parageobacillus toebii TaxID=153151 RepID=UPI00281537BF|nr:zinc-finger domain-containing protein [Parageobacillus toebii]MED4990119.1 zinc-finger domain-containing protein [Parageobacillus toebii]WMT19175.1 zinc-finger domain-containing protein [Parageobacillus toebii]
MTREEKKQIRLRIIKLLDTNCSSCKERSERRDSPCLTDCPIGKRMRQLSSMLEEDHINVSVTEETKRKGKWTNEEEFYLWHHRHILTIDQLAEKLNRDEQSVYNKLCRLKKKGGIQHVS